MNIFLPLYPLRHRHNVKKGIIYLKTKYQMIVYIYFKEDLLFYNHISQRIKSQI